MKSTRPCAGKEALHAQPPAPTIAMLLLPLMIYWARKPFYFCRPLRISCVVSIMAICFSAPPCSIALAGEGFGDAASPLTRQFQPSDEQPNVVPHVDVVHLREGTTITNVAGRFTMIGRRWAFIPDQPIGAVAATPAASTNQRTFESVTTQNGNSTRIEMRSTTTTDTKPSQPGRAGIPQILVLENLMLQRVAEAIRLDSSDDRWLVTGEALEFFDDNVLLLKTARRAAINKETAE